LTLVFEINGGRQEGQGQRPSIRCLKTQTPLKPYQGRSATSSLQTAAPVWRACWSSWWAA